MWDVLYVPALQNVSLAQMPTPTPPGWITQMLELALAELIVTVMITLLTYRNDIQKWLIHDRT